ncbi:Alpha/Beta hydrolase protein [Aspergillus filifer]
MGAWSFVAAALLALAPCAFAVSTDTKTITGWDLIEPSPDLRWVSCFQKYKCARLQVPLDYGNPSRGSTAIAFVKLPARNATSNTRDVLINPGGPGNSGVANLIGSRFPFTDVIPAEYNVIGFDPRGIGHSGPEVDCWPGHPEIRAQFEKLFSAETSNASSTSLTNQFYAADFFGKACTPSVGGTNGSAAFISTPAVARDMLTFIKAEQRRRRRLDHEVKLNYYGLSYGTVLGTTFAHLFPDNVGRMVLDGVADAEDTYNGGWRHNLYDADEAIHHFYQSCYDGGPQNCSFWGPSVGNIERRFRQLLDHLKYNPIPVSSSPYCSIPLLATYSVVKQIALQAIYLPVTRFPILADVLAGLEKGNATAYMVAATSFISPNPCNNGTAGTTSDVAVLIRCVDAAGGTVRLNTLQKYRDYVDFMQDQSKILGEAWPAYASDVSCRSFDVRVPETGKLQGSILDPRNTATPILFVTSAVDPVTPKRGAYKMSSVFENSTVLIQNSVGHGAIGSLSSCVVRSVQAYYSHGQLPPPDTVCEPDVVSFQAV